MNKKENLFTTTLRLNLNNAQDMEAWNNLMSTDRNQPEYSSYSRTIVTAINDHFARQDRMEEQQEWETALLKKIEATIRETFANCLQGLQITTLQPTTEKSKLPAQPDPPDEMEERIVAFLDNF
jgi:hypothetical protein